MKPATSKAKPPERKPRVWLVVCVGAFLVLAVFAVFGQTADFAFINYDDNANVYENLVVQKGLSLQTVGWAFTHAQVCNWIPLTTLSHMLDCQLFGLNAGGPHLVNVLLHAANAVLLFLLLRQMTGNLWRGAFVAAVFALHPLRAESVAWVSERKDVLSGFFFLLTIGAYVRHLRKPSRAGYFAILLLFALGLMAKSMVATLPFVLLLLDYWPLGRLQNWRQFLRLVGEKIPMFALAAGACLVTALMPGMVVAQARRLPLLERAGNALVSYLIYLRQTVFPAGLALPYPNDPPGPAAGKICLAIVVLTALTAVALWRRKKSPGLLVGWLWYLGMLVPVIGLVQISSDAAHADRYTYLPGIGLALAATWAVGDWSAGWKPQRMVAGGMMIAVISALIFTGSVQISYWRDDQTLWTHALACTSNNSVAHNNLGYAFDAQGRLEEAISQYHQALAIKPGYATAHNNLGVDLVQKGDMAEAMAHFQQALTIYPGDADAHCNLGNILLQQGKLEDAIAQYRAALQSAPDHPQALHNLARALAMKGDARPASR